MRSTRIRWAAGVLSCLVGGAVAAAPIQAASASSHKPATHQKAKKPSFPPGFYVGDRDANVQKVENYGTPSALVRDDNGVEHLVTTKPVKGDPTMGHIEYLTRQSDNGKWKAHAIPGARNISGGVQVEAHLSFNGKRIFAVFYECDGVFTLDAPVGSSRLPLPTQVTELDNCAAPPASSDNPPVALAGSESYSRTIQIMLPDPAQGGALAVYSGLPNGSFAPGTAIPTSHDFVPQQLAADTIYGGLVVVGEGSDGTNLGIYSSTQSRFSDTWSDPTLIASLNSPTTDYKIDSVQLYDRHTYIGLEKPTTKGQHVAHTLFLDQIKPSGQTNGAVPLSHTNGDDHNLRLVVNTGTNHLHAVWTRIIPGVKTGKSGIMHEAQNDNGWISPTYVSHSSLDVPTQITLTAARHPIVGFNQK